MNFKFQVSSFKLIPRTLLALCVLLGSLPFMAPSCSTGNVVKWSEKSSRYSANAARIVQTYVDDGSCPNCSTLVAGLNKFSTGADALATAFKAGGTNTVDLAANLTTALDNIIQHDILVIPAGWMRTAVLVALAIVDDALHDIAADLAAKAETLRHHAVFGRFVQQAEKSKAAETLRKFAKKPRLRCRDAATGRFLKMERCKASPESTIIERVEPKPKATPES